jgi:PPOX class probable F420-dependent enzyme
MRIKPELARQRFSAARAATLATVSGAGEPHLVPVTFALLGLSDQPPTAGADRALESIVFAVDHKPKSTIQLRRLDNIAANPRVALLADVYDDDWNRLWWVRADAVAAVAEGVHRGAAIAALRVKYQQYRSTPPGGVVVSCRVMRWSGWQAAPLAE